MVASWINFTTWPRATSHVSIRYIYCSCQYFNGHVQETTPFIISIAEFYVVISGCCHDFQGDYKNVWGKVQTV